MGPWARLGSGASGSDPRIARQAGGVTWICAAITACLLLSGCEPSQPPDAKLTVNNIVISREEAAREMRDLLWRRSLPWESQDSAAKEKLRREAIDALVEKRLVADFATKPPYVGPVSPDDAEAAFQQFILQFEPPDHWKQRIELQGLTEAQLRERLTSELAQTRAIGSWLKTERKANATQLNEAAAQKWFAAHREAMRLPERVRASHIFLTAHDLEKPDRTAEMAELQRKLIAGEAAFAQLAGTVSDDERSKKVGGDLG
ncbi:MAG TPA: peptidylprolyl isomerase, partial [Candidatus Saccharimonadia bacterium]|nr:peptidylprolyl isomerase [Candidatus Saccharimonadia bacterium]